MEINIVKLKKYASECSVLYVEDDELIRTQTASFLGRFFPDVVLAEDGKIGLEKYKERSFDIVITDINMPNMNGIEMIEAIKEIKYEQIALVTSAYNDTQYLMSLINLNVMRFVLKPFNNKQFLYIIYKIAEEINFRREKLQLENEVISLSKKAQKIVDKVDVGIIVIKENKIDMANKAFLDIAGFDTFDKLLSDMPEISVLFEKAAHRITASTNSELINELKVLHEERVEDSKVIIMKNLKTIEYQIILTELEDEEGYILTFTDITAVHNALSSEEHTQLPSKKYTLEKIEFLKQKSTELNVILMGVKNFDTIKKWYGKKDSIEVEGAFSKSITNIIDTVMPDAFVGYFDKNQLIVIPTDSNFEKLYKELKKINIGALNIVKKHEGSGMKIELFTDIKQECLDASKSITEIEVDIINAFDLA